MHVRALSPDLLHIDAFTGVPFRGNPAAVCILSEPRKTDWMQALAADLNLSETAFVIAAGDEFDLRWFTPQVEVDLCGHATLATAHALWSGGFLPEDRMIRFRTRSGVLTAVKKEEWIHLDFPAEPPEPVSLPSGLLSALGVRTSPVAALRNRLGYVVHLCDEEEVRSLNPDFSSLMRVERNLEVMVTARARDPYDFISRFFAPGIGIPEDPVTGAAHACLGPYWAEKLGKSSLSAYQASSRGGEVKVTVNGDRVILSGQAVTISEGRLSSDFFL